VGAFTLSLMAKIRFNFEAAALTWPKVRTNFYFLGKTYAVLPDSLIV
jgi:hypothetical protein